MNVKVVSILWCFIYAPLVIFAMYCDYKYKTMIGYLLPFLFPFFFLKSYLFFFLGSIMSIVFSLSIGSMLLDSPNPYFSPFSVETVMIIAIISNLLIHCFIRIIYKLVND